MVLPVLRSCSESVTASYSILTTLSSESQYVTYASIFPGNPCSPSGLRRWNFTPTRPFSTRGSPFQTNLSKPLGPPWHCTGSPARVSFATTSYLTPSISNEAWSIRLPKRPITGPKKRSVPWRHRLRLSVSTESPPRRWIGCRTAPKSRKTAPARGSL